MFTDHLGNPIQTGDKILYPDSRGSLTLAEVIALIPLVPYPDSRLTKANVFARADQLGGSKRPTEFYGGYMDYSTRPSVRRDRYDDPAKRYVIQVMKGKRFEWRTGPDEKRYTLPTTQVVVVPDDSEIG